MRRTMKHNATQLVFNDFSGGINVMSEGDLIAQNEMQECQNFYFLGYQRSLTARGGLSKPLVTFPGEVMGTSGSFHKIREIEPVLTGRFCAWYFPTKGGKYHVQNLFYS